MSADDGETPTMKKLILAGGALAAGASLMYAAVTTLETPIEMADATAHAAKLTVSTDNYAPQGWLAKSLPEIAEGLAAGEVSSVALVEAYQARIKRIDRSGPNLRSVLSLNPAALEEAKRLDDMRANGQSAGPLHGVPILLKDNIESADPVATTAGALALKDNITGRDSPLVAGLRRAGAIILGKTNLSQWANFRSNDSMSGWSALGGQVKNPHILDRNPCGSSSGSGSAMAASLAAGTVGTETNGSIICPSNINGIVGFKPTVGLVAQDLIVPISSSQDTAGPMTKTVKGAAMMMNAMATGDGKVDYVAALEGASLSGKKVGVLNFSRGSNKDINAAFDKALEALEAAGAVLVQIDENPLQAEGFWADARSLLYFEFKATINDYLANTPASVTPRTLEELIAFNEANADVELALFDQSIFTGAQEKAGLDDPDYARARDKIQKATREDGIDALLAAHDVEVLVAPSGALSSRRDEINGDVWPSFPGAGSMAAIAGYPHATVPMATVHGLPIGFSFIGTAGTDADILAAAYAFEQAAGGRVDPAYLEHASERPEIAAALEGYLHQK